MMNRYPAIFLKYGMTSDKINAIHDRLSLAFTESQTYLSISNFDEEKLSQNEIEPGKFCININVAPNDMKTALKCMANFLASDIPNVKVEIASRSFINQQDYQPGQEICLLFTRYAENQQSLDDKLIDSLIWLGEEMKRVKVGYNLEDSIPEEFDKKALIALKIAANDEDNIRFHYQSLNPAANCADPFASFAMVNTINRRSSNSFSIFNDETCTTLGMQAAKNHEEYKRLNKV